MPAKKERSAVFKPASRTEPALADLKKAAQTKDTAAMQRAVKRIQQVDDKKVNQLARDAGARSCGSA